MKLILGVLDQHYSQVEQFSTGISQVKTTGDVAEILEKNYHVMETFFALKKDKIADVLADSMAGAIQQLVRGVNNPTDPFLEGPQRVEGMFREFLDADEMSRLFAKFAAAPLSAAAAAGQSKRFKKYSAKRKPRPAFIDTGLYRASMRAWIVGDSGQVGTVTSIAA